MGCAGAQQSCGAWDALELWCMGCAGAGSRLQPQSSPTQARGHRGAGWVSALKPFQRVFRAALGKRSGLQTAVKDSGRWLPLRPVIWRQEQGQ